MLDHVAEKVIALVDRSNQPLKPEIRELIDQYAPPRPQSDRALREIALVAANAVLGALLIISLFVGMAVGSPYTESSVGRAIYYAVLSWCVFGGILHLLRFYDARWLAWRDVRRPGGVEKERSLRWPRVTSDLDLVVQTAFAILIGFLV